MRGFMQEEGRGKSKCKGPGAGLYLLYWKSSEAVMRLEWSDLVPVSWEVWSEIPAVARSQRTLWNFGFYSENAGDPPGG